MTTIIAIEREGRVAIAADSQTTFGRHRASTGEAHKIFVNNGMVFAVAGSVRGSSVIRYADLPSPDDAGWDVDRWVTTSLIPALIKAWEGARALEISSSIAFSTNAMLVVVKDRVYKIDPDQGWTRNVDGVYAVGSGGDFALGALYSGSGMLEALRAAAALDVYTALPLTFTTADALLEGRDVYEIVNDADDFVGADSADITLFNDITA